MLMQLTDTALNAIRYMRIAAVLLFVGAVKINEWF